MSGPVDVLAVMDDASLSLKFSYARTDMREARAAVAELIEAVEKNREALDAFAQDGKPENYFPFDDSERRVLAALRRVRGEA